MSITRVASLLVCFLVAFLGLSGNATAQHACDKVASFKHLIPTGPEELVRAVPGQRVYFCGFTITQKGNTLDLVIMYGQGTNCDTNMVAVTPQLELPNDLAISSRQENVGPSSEAGYALCVQTLGSNAKLGGMIYYAQF